MAMDPTDLIIKARSIQWQYRLDQYTTEQINTIRAALKKSTAKMEKYIAAKAGAPVGKGGWTRDKYLEYIESLEPMNKALEKELTERLLGTGSDVYKVAVKKFEGIISFNGLAKINMNTLSPAQLRRFAENVSIGGPTLKTWIDKTLTSETQTKIRNEILAGTFAGENLNQLKARVGVAYDRFNKTTIETLTRTHIQSANNQARQDVFEANSDIIKGVKWLATLDGSCCYICGGLDGREYKLGHSPQPPIHPRCRCVLLPVTVSYKELGVNMAEIKDNFRPELIKGRHTLTTRDFKHRFADMTKAEKISHIGPGRYDRITKGGLSYADLIDGETGRALLLPELDDLILTKAIKKIAKHDAMIETLMVKAEAEIAKAEASKAKSKAILEDIKAKKAQKVADLEDAINDPNKTAVFKSNTELPEGKYKATAGPGKQAEAMLPDEPETFAPIKGKHNSAGAVLIDKDTGKVWVMEPKGHYGGYKHTFPKGTIEDGLTAQQTALKEVWEETGLNCKIVGYVGDYEKSASLTRYYVAEVTGGSPAAFGAETQSMKLVPMNSVKALLNNTVDKGVFDDFAGKLAQAQGKVVAGEAKSLKGGFYKVGKEAKAAEKLALEEAQAKAALKAAQEKAALKAAQEAEAQAAKLAEEAAKTISDGKSLSELTAKEKQHLSYLKKNFKDNWVPGETTNAMKTWNSLSAQAQEGVLKAYVKKGGSIPDMLPLKEGVAKTYIMPQAVKSAVKIEKLNLDDYVKYDSQKGSNTGGFYHHKNNPSDRWYMKFPGNEDIASNEMLAARLYEKAGTEVPVLRWVEADGRKGIASKIIDGLENNSDLLTSPAFRAGIYDDFVVDCFMGNWDVVGMNYDNLLIKDGIRAVRVDVGGSLRYRAMGGLKDKNSWNGFVDELENMRNPGLNPKAANVFKDITQAELDAGARKVLSITEKDIRVLVDKYGPSIKAERDELVDVLLARQKDIQAKFPHIKINTAAVDLPEDLGGRVQAGQVKQIKEARLNGHSLRTDKDHIEDQQILFWTEKDAAGNTITCCEFKAIGPAAKKLQAAVAGAADGVVDSTRIVIAEINTANRSITKALKGIGYQFNGGNGLRTLDIERATEALADIKKAKAALRAVVKSGDLKKAALDNYTKALVKWEKVLDGAVQAGEGAIYKLPRGYYTPTSNTFERVAKAAPKVETNAVAWKKKAGVFEEKKIENGYAQRTGGSLDLTYEPQGAFSQYYEAKINGVDVRFFYDQNDKGFALRDKVQIFASGADRKTANLIYDAIEELGIDASIPSALDIEELYLRQILNHRNETKFIDSLVTPRMTTEQRVEAYKKHLENKLGYDVSATKSYDPMGAYQAFEQGKICTYRPDLLEHPSWADFKENYVLKHSMHGDLSGDIDRILNGGGMMAPTTDKISRRGFRWGGMSPERDNETGGANYFFTRVKRLTDSSVADEGLYFKPELVARLDAVSYDADRYGNVTKEFLGAYRKPSLEEIKDCSSYGSNETIFKKSLSILGDIDHIKVHKYNYKALMDVFKKHNIVRLPDGRLVKDIIRKI